MSGVPTPEGLHAVLVSTSTGGCSRVREGQGEPTERMELLLYKQILKELWCFSLERRRLREHKSEK